MIGASRRLVWDGDGWHSKAQAKQSKVKRREEKREVRPLPHLPGMPRAFISKNLWVLVLIILLNLPRCGRILAFPSRGCQRLMILVDGCTQTTDQRKHRCLRLYLL